LPIADVAHIVHGPIACAGSSWDNRGTRSSGPTLYKIGMTTDLTEQWAQAGSFSSSAMSLACMTGRSEWVLRVKGGRQTFCGSGDVMRAGTAGPAARVGPTVVC
jgi:hypothetical protein